jgi:hypothetical protein
VTFRWSRRAGRAGRLRSRQRRCAEGPQNVLGGHARGIKQLARHRAMPAQRATTVSGSKPSSAKGGVRVSRGGRKCVSENPAVETCVLLDPTPGLNSTPTLLMASAWPASGRPPPAWTGSSIPCCTSWRRTSAGHGRSRPVVVEPGRARLAGNRGSQGSSVDAVDAVCRAGSVASTPTRSSGTHSAAAFSGRRRGR